MLTLFVLGGSSVGSSFECRGGEVLGRSPDCAIRLQDRSVSRSHARLERDGNSWVVVDLGSRNGVFVNDQRVERAVLTDGLEITVGEVPLRVRIEGSSTEAPPPEAAPAPPPKPPSREPKPSPKPRIETEEFVLEEDDEIDRELVKSAPDRAAAPAGTTKLKGAEARRREILRQGADGGGWLGGDLAQRPLWLQALVGLFLLLVFAGFAYGAWWAVLTLRSG